MIGIDSSEGRSNSKTIFPDHANSLDWLEEMTGADAVISPLESAPFATHTLPLHIRRGAVLVQIKHGGDLVSSIGDRMNEHISKMVRYKEEWSVPMHSWQRVLAPVGLYRKDPKTGMVQVANNPHTYEPYYITAEPPKSWEALQTALWRWRKRGGSIEPLILTPEDLKVWMEREEIDLKKMSEEDKYVWLEAPALYGDPEPDDPLQEVQVIKDGRVLLASLPGIGQKRAQDLWDHAGGDLKNALIFITSSGLPLPRGIGDKTRESVRDFFDMDIWDFDLVESTEHQMEALDEEIDRLGIEGLLDKTGGS